MISIVIPIVELYNSDTLEFSYPVPEETTIRLEHSLESLQKWEARWHKPFLDKTEKTVEETLDYIRCMSLTPNIDHDIFKYIPKTEMDKISKYIDDPMTATWFSSDKNNTGHVKKEVVTAEIIYWWMISLGIPSEYRKWNLNQLITLIRVINIKNTPKKKRKQGDILREHERLNNLRRSQLHSKG